jgi:DNA-binding response OmpR family regulator
MVYGNKKVLVVEDDDFLRKLMIEQLSEKYVVVSARDGEEAVKSIIAENPDLLVLDLLLPKLDGFSVLQQLRDMADPKKANMPVLVVSNLASQERVDKARQYGILEYYIKADINFGILTKRIERYFQTGR